MLVTFRKNPDPVCLHVCDDEQFTSIIKDLITNTIQNGINDTNGIMMAIMEWVLRNMIIIGNVDVFKLLNNNYLLKADGRWGVK